MFEPKHMHFYMQAYSFDTIKDPRKLKVILRKLVRHVKMKVATPPQAKYIEEEGNEGLTGSIGLHTSHASVHIWDKDGLVMFDLYSCTEFSVDKLLSFVIKEFNLITNNDQKLLMYTVIDRAEVSSYTNSIYK